MFIIIIIIVSPLSKSRENLIQFFFVYNLIIQITSFFWLSGKAKIYFTNKGSNYVPDAWYQSVTVYYSHFCMSGKVTLLCCAVLKEFWMTCICTLFDWFRKEAIWVSRYRRFSTHTKSNLWLFNATSLKLRRLKIDCAVTLSQDLSWNSVAWQALWVRLWHEQVLHDKLYESGCDMNKCCVTTPKLVLLWGTCM